MNPSDQRTTLPTSRPPNPSSKTMFCKRTGTTDKGKKYEDYVVATLVLKMLADDKIKNFNLSSNDNNFGDFDDVVFEIEKTDQSEEKYAIQLKHKNNTTKKLSFQSLTATGGDFSLHKYFTSFQKLRNSVEGYKLILMTNSEFDISDGTEIQLDADKSFRIKIIEENAISLVNTRKTKKNCYKFQIISDRKTTTKELEEYKHFFDQFYLYTKQANLDKLEMEIPEQIRKQFFCESRVLDDVQVKYLRFISEWNFSEGEKHKLYKKMMQRIVALYLATPFVHPICFGPVTENGKILQQAISRFDITVFDEKSKDHVRKLWGDVKNRLGVIPEVNKKRKKYQITSECINDISNLSETKCTELLWITNKCPLIVSESPSVYEAIKLCRDRKFVLIGADSVNLKKYSVFHKLSDLKVHDDVLRDLSTNFMCSLSGQEVNLEHLLQQSDTFHEIITTNELLEMVDHSYKIIGEIEELPEHYVSRQVSKHIIDFKYLDSADKDLLIVISNVRPEHGRNSLQKFNLIDVDDYLKVNSENNKELGTRYQKQDDSKNISQTRNLYIKKDLCSQKEILNLCKKNENKGKYHHFKICGEMLEWVESSCDISSLRQHRIEGHFVEESELCPTYSQNNIQLIADDPGMGKSWIMKSLKSKFLAEILTIILSPADMLAICNFLQEMDPHFTDIEDFIINLKYSNCDNFNKHVLNIVMKNGQVIYLWDALDEILFDKNVAIITKLIVKMSENNSRHWLTCRRNLKISLETKFNIFSRGIVEFAEEQQTSYIQERLKSVCSEEDLNEAVQKIMNNVAFANHRDILSVPLQIYMLTELCRQNKEKYLNLLREVFSITDLYEYFIEEKFNIYYKDKINVIEPFARKLKETHKHLYINQYEKTALSLILESEFLKDLNTGCDDFLKDSKQQDDCLGFVTETKENKVQFTHISYAEYFVATYFSKKKNSKLSEILFKEKYSNVRFFFDMLLAKNSPAHIAVLYKNLPELKKCGDEIFRKDSGGRSPLHIACSWGKIYPVLEFEKIDNYYYQLYDDDYLVQEEEIQYRQILDYLLTRCDINETDHMFNMSSFSYASKCNCFFAIATIAPQLKIGCFNSNDENFNCSVLLYSVKRGFEAVVNLFENIKNILTRKYETLLHLASANGYEKIADLLIKSGIGVNTRNYDNNTPLHLAASSEHNEVLKLLIKSEADINAVSRSGKTPLHEACRKSDAKAPALLIKCGAHINATDKQSWTPLHTACVKSSYEVIKLLLNSKVDINALDVNRKTPLHVASNNDNAEAAALLIEFGANVNATDNNSKTPLHAACFNRSYEVIKLLLNSKADINALDHDGRTPLHAAFFNKIWSQHRRCRQCCVLSR